MKAETRKPNSERSPKGESRRGRGSRGEGRGAGLRGSTAFSGLHWCGLGLRRGYGAVNGLLSTSLKVVTLSILGRAHGILLPTPTRTWLSGLCAALVLAGCAQENVKGARGGGRGVEEWKGGRVEFPALPGDVGRGARVEVGSGETPPPPAAGDGRVTVVLAWSNVPVGLPVTWKTGVEGSTNLVNWELIAMVPYASSNLVTLSNQPAVRFYRVYNTY